MNSTSRTLLLAGLAVVAAACSKRPDELPDMGLSRSTLSFEAPGGSGDPAAQTVYVVNTGRGSLAKPTVKLAYQDGSGWLSATVSGSSAPYDVALQARVGALAPGTYHATATLSCENASSSPAQVDVTFTVPDPRFTLSVSSLEFTVPRGGAGEPAAKTFQVINAGRGTLPVPEVATSYVGPTGWLSTVVSGTPDAYVVTVTPHGAGMDSGTYTATLSISAAAAEGPARTLAVTLTVPPAELALSKADLRMEASVEGSDPPPVEVSVANGGAGLLAPPAATVSYAAGYAGPEWLTATVAGSGAPYTVTLVARQSRFTTALPSGTYGATVSVSSPNASNSPQTIAVTLVVPPPRMELSPDRFTLTRRGTCAFPSNTSPVAVTNRGAGALAPPTVVVPPEAAAWLDVRVTGDSEQYWVLFTPKQEPPVGSTTVVLQSPPAEPRDVTITYEITEVTEVALRPTSLAIHGQQGLGDPLGRLTVTTVGGCVPAPTVSVADAVPAEPTWLTTSISTWGERHAITVRAATGGMVPGDTRDATLAIAGAGSAVSPSYASDVPVHVTVGAFGQTGTMVTERGWGFTLAPLHGDRAVAAGGQWGPPSATAEIYDAATGRWTATGPMTVPRTMHGAGQLASGEVIVCGGATLDNQSSRDSCETTDGSVWTPAARMLSPRREPTLVTLPSGKLLVVSADAMPELYDPVHGGLPWWDYVGPDHDPTYGSSAVMLADDRVLVTGSSWSTHAFIFDPASGSWSRTGDTHEPHSWPALLLLPDGRVVAMGYGGDQPYSNVEIWDPASGAWTETSASANGHDAGNTVALSNGKVIGVAGRYASVEVATIDLFDPATETWSVAATFPSGRSDVRLARLGNGLILMAGGQLWDYSTSSYPTNSASLEAFTW